MSKNYKEIYAESLNNPEEFWKNVSEDVFWFKKPSKILNKSKPPFYKWFEDGITNTSVSYTHLTLPTSDLV